MSTDQQQYQELIRRWFSGEESDDDALTLDTYLQDESRHPELVSALEQEFNGLAAAGYPEWKAKELAGTITAKDGGKGKGRLRFLSGWRAAAASVLLVLGLAGYFWASHNSQTASVVTAVKSASIAPGKPGAVLTLADGSQVSLDSVQNATVAMQGGVKARVVNGALLYEGRGDKAVYHTISTPKGREYRITLPDGSGVWLNAGSSIRYPTSFSGATRHVTITGEVYFEVAADKNKPFVVDVNSKAMVQVLGTHFNINAYNNESHIATTLLEGSVLTSPGPSASPASVKLRPGQQALIAAGAAVSEPPTVKTLNDADIEKVMAWKNGLFNFNGASLEEVMKQLERWYDIEVIYAQGIPERKLVGKMTKDISLEGLLIGLKELGINCRLEGRKLIVLPS